MVGINVFFAAPILESVSVPGNKRNQVDMDRYDPPFCQVPVRPKGFMMIIEIDSVRPVNLVAGFDAKIITEMKWLGLFFQPKDEKELVWNLSFHRLSRIQDTDEPLDRFFIVKSGMDIASQALPFLLSPCSVFKNLVH